MKIKLSILAISLVLMSNAYAEDLTIIAIDTDACAVSLSNGTVFVMDCEEVKSLVIGTPVPDDIRQRYGIESQDDEEDEE